LFAAALGCPTLATAPAVAAQTAAGTLVIEVLDPTGASVPYADIVVHREGGAADSPPTGASAAMSPADGAIVRPLAPGIYRVQVRAPGFEPVELTAIEVRASRETRRRVQLRLARFRESVEVARDARSSALDPRGFSTFLSREQIDALPDDPEAFVRALQDLAPPGAVVRIDGFTGAPLPPKSQILSIRIPRLDSFAAQDHGGLGGGAYIDIVTRPGGGEVRAMIEGGIRNQALAARNPIASARAPESIRSGTLAVDGPVLTDRMSFSFAVRAASVRETTALRAALPDGRQLHDPVVRPQETLTASGRVTAGLGTHILRVSASSDSRRAGNLGIGDRNLPERGYSSVSSDSAVRIAAGGPLGRRSHLESRVQLQWTGRRTASYTETRTERVLDAFSAGGAQMTGGARERQVMVAADLDHARGAHAWRFGLLLEHGRHRVNRSANYLGTYTFTSLADYAAGRPATYTRRIGDGRVRYSNAQLGLYVQDDVRVARSVLLSYGVRYEHQPLAPVPGALLPRASVAWSPSAAGRTTIRAGVGEFADWISTSTLEQSLLVNGERQYDVLLLHPAYPDPAAGGAAVPRERYLLGADLRLPRGTSLSVGIDRQLASRVRVYATYVQRAGRRLPRGENLNLPDEGVRPDPAFGNVVAARSDARSRTRSVTVQVLTSPRGRWVDAAAAYMFTAAEANTAGAYALAATGNDPATEWGPSVPAHVATGSLAVSLGGGIRVSVNPRWRSGLPYTITTGRDDNGDGLFTDRPPGLARNSARTPSHLEIGARVSYLWQFGPRRDARGVIPSAGGDGQSVRAGAVAVPDGGGDPASARRFRLEIFASGQNLANRPNYIAVGSVQGSPLFATPTAAINPRRIDVGMRFGF
jgi:hypothetical protein